MLTFNSKFYSQIKGTAMCTVFARTYANLTGGYYESLLYYLPEPANILKIPGSDI